MELAPSILAKGCRFNDQGKCRLLSTAMGILYRIDPLYCVHRCGPKDDDKKMRMLEMQGIFLSRIPDDPEGLEEQIEEDPPILSEDRKREQAAFSQQNAVAAQRKAKIREAVKAELPGKYQMVKNLGKNAFKVIAHYKKTQRIFATEAEQARRLSICTSCEMMVVEKNSMRCGHNSCGCHLDGDYGKSRFESLECEAQKWQINTG